MHRPENGAEESFRPTETGIIIIGTGPQLECETDATFWQFNFGNEFERHGHKASDGRFSFIRLPNGA